MFEWQAFITAFGKDGQDMINWRSFQKIASKGNYKANTPYRSKERTMNRDQALLFAGIEAGGTNLFVR